MMTTTITQKDLGAEDFMRHLANLEEENGAAARRQFVAYYAANKEHGPHRFEDGVVVDMSLHVGMEYGEDGEDAPMLVYITLLRNKKLLLVEVEDLRGEEDVIIHTELVSLPKDFYKFLRNKVCTRNRDKIKYHNFIICVQQALNGDSLAVFDRARKLRALREILGN